MSIKVHMLTLGALQTNCFIVADTKSGDAIIIDPAAEAEKILGVIGQHGYSVRRILATHAHFDHILASHPVQEATGAPFHLHRADVPQLVQMQRLAAAFGITAPPPALHDGTIDEGDVIEVGAIRLETFFTPGHSPGHVIFVMRNEKIALSGDCVFMGGIGRTDLPGGDFDTLMTSIFAKILPLGDDFTLGVGHGPPTTIANERQHNPYIALWAERS